MKKIINDPMAFVDEMLEGILAAHPDQLKATEDPRALVRADAPVQGKVAILTGGGSGHLPVFLGYVGRRAWPMAAPWATCSRHPAPRRCTRLPWPRTAARGRSTCTATIPAT